MANGGYGAKLQATSRSQRQHIYGTHGREASSLLQKGQAVHDGEQFVEKSMRCETGQDHDGSRDSLALLAFSAASRQGLQSRTSLQSRLHLSIRVMQDLKVKPDLSSRSLPPKITDELNVLRCCVKSAKSMYRVRPRRAY